MPLLVCTPPTSGTTCAEPTATTAPPRNENADSQQKSAPGVVPVLRASAGGEELTSDPDASARVDGGVVEHHRGGRVVVEFGVDVLVQHVAREGVEVRDGRPRRVGGGGRGDAVDSTAGLLRGVVHGERDEETSLLRRTHPGVASGGGRERRRRWRDREPPAIGPRCRPGRDGRRRSTRGTPRAWRGNRPQHEASTPSSRRRRRNRTEQDLEVECEVSHDLRGGADRASAEAAVASWCFSPPIQQENSPSRSRVSSPAKLPITIGTISMGFSLKCLLVQREDVR